LKKVHERVRRIYPLDKFQEGMKRLDKELAQEQEGHDLERSHAAKAKRKLLKDMHNDLRAITKHELSVFLSFPDRIQHEVSQIKDRALKKHGFSNVYTGYDPDVRKSKNLRSGIIYKIREATCFLGIWTDDIQIRGPAGQDFFGPGIWMSIELGIALSLEKPIRLLIKKGLNPQLINPVSDFPHFWYEDQVSFDRAASEALATLADSISYHED
jgi:hypothetical protein